VNLFHTKMLVWVAVATLLSASGLMGVTDQPRSSASGYAPVNGLKMYYEIHGSGSGPALVVLHGGLGSGAMFQAIVPELSKGRQVILVDLQGHGRTADISRPLSYQAMADDIASLIRYLKLDRADVMGYSVGGGVAARLGIQHPDVVRKLVVVSATYKRDGWYPELLAGMAQMNSATAEQMKGSPMYRAYTSVAPRPQDWPTLVEKLGLMLKQDYDWSQEVSAIKAPVLLVFGDADGVRPEHAVEFFELLGGGKRDGGWDGSGMPGSQLAVLPGQTHYTIFMQPSLAEAVVHLLDAPMPKSK